MDLGGIPTTTTDIGVPLSQFLGHEARTLFPNPAPGATLTTKVPGGRVWRPRTLHVQFNTSAAVANRTVFVQAQNADGVSMWVMGSGGSIAASSGQSYVASWGAGFISSGVVGDGVFCCPQTLLRPGDTLTVGAAGLQAGDQFSSAFFVYDSFIEGTNGYEIGRAGPLGVDAVIPPTPLRITP